MPRRRRWRSRRPGKTDTVKPADRIVRQHQAPFSGHAMRGFLDDVRHALRQLAAHPAFTLAAIASLTLGLGANTTIFSVANALLLRPMPVPRPDEMVKVYVGRHSPFGFADLEYFRAHEDHVAPRRRGSGSRVAARRERF